MKTIHSALLVVLVLSLAGGRAATAQSDDGKSLQVVASFSILADWTRAVAGTRARVYSLVGADADAHVYDPTPADVERVAKADLLILNGLGFEGWMVRLKSASGFRGRSRVATDGIRPRRVGDEIDPHAWQDLRNARTYILNIANALSEAEPASASYFAERATSYLREIDALDIEFRRAIAQLPRDRLVVLTSHDAFGYLESSYGITMLSARGLSTDAEPSAAQIGALIRQIRQEKVTAVFVENIKNPRLIEQIAKEGGVAVGGQLYSDALGPQGSPAATFVDMYRHNMRTLLGALRVGAADAGVKSR
jgi:zinc/manganese transport system substrate-binding protein